MKLKFVHSIVCLWVLLVCSNQVFGGQSGIQTPEITSKRPSIQTGGLLNLTTGTKKVIFDPALLNLKSPIEPEKSLANAAISITQAEFQNLASEGNSWVNFLTENEQISIFVGVANNSSPQQWTLPDNTYTLFEYYERSDFIEPNSVPIYLDLPTGTSHVMKTPYESSDNFTATNYQYFNISGASVTFLGEDYDFDAETDDDFDSEPDFIFAHVPLALNDTYTTSVERSLISVNGSLYKENVTTSVDGYGTIATPDGTFDCLRIKDVVNKFSRTSPSGTFVSAGSETRYRWVSDNGFTFGGTVVSENPTTHIATLSNITLTKIVLTSILSETTDVVLNNDSKGVTINSTNNLADASAILDITSTNKGILIPRVSQANRPANPAEGLLIYQIDNTAGFYYYDGNDWQKINSTPPAASPLTSKTQSILPATGGIGALTDGTAFIKFNQIQENPENLIILIQAEGDCNGLFISNKTKEGFEVRELQKGKSNVKFSYTTNQK